MTSQNPYKLLAGHLDRLPNGFPPTDDGVELKLLARLFSPEEAWLAAQLRSSLETPEQIAARLEVEAPSDLRDQLKSMARRGLIRAGRTEAGIGFATLPFVVGIYEMQVDRLDAEFAALVEEYFHRGFWQILDQRPAVHRVIPVAESVRVDMRIEPYESVADILATAQAWGVLDCICRKQKALIGQPCEHPVDVCLAMSQKPGAFDQLTTVQALSFDQALDVLKRAARAGLVHSVSNSQSGIGYICNCCTCSCGVLRGMAEMGLAGVVAHSSFVNRVDEDSCVGCELCLESCMFGALSMNGVVRVDALRCAGCGVCVSSCPEGALGLVQRPPQDVELPPADEFAWQQARLAARGLDPESIT
jgi:H+/Na+-translocating ferredoxin:NAD+ oxidoreductase subunit B